ncbi:hypothetical protein [Flavitalea sp.]|nr:hypothetical protein [Flavitalea sp.]
MKFYLSILTLSLSTVSPAQTTFDIEKRLKLLNNHAAFAFDTTGFSKIPPLKDYFCDDQSFRKWDSYHVVDLNNDGIDDLIYSGPCRPYPQTGIFLNDGQKLKQIHDSPGQIIALEQTTKGTIINILKEACCCDYFSEYTAITIYNDSGVDKNVITFDGNTKITLDKLHETEIKGTLRSSPKINDIVKKDDCSEETIKGNHVRYISKLTKVVELTSSGKWRLVFYPENKKQSWIGWIRL